MAKHEFFKDEFNRLATDGFIGDPNGKPAYAYIRVSSDEQGEEGRSGLPRQILHVHEKALVSGYRITWDRVFADDFTGTVFEERPELSRLRHEYKGKATRASAVVMEHLDRLSRHADWHQGYLLEEMKKAGVDAVFWKSYSSRVERAVMGAVAQEGMEQTRQRMKEGLLHKARSGRVTAHRANFGYQFVDENGNTGDRARKMSYYAIHEERGPIVRLIYERLAAGDTLYGIAASLTDMGVATPKSAPCWTLDQLRYIVKNPVYKGEFIAHRWIDRQVEKPTADGLSTRMVRVREMYPEEEWIRVPVPAIVDAALWQSANDMLAKNKLRASRNGRHPYLLTGLLKCAECGYSYVGRTYERKTSKGPYHIYMCSTVRLQPRHLKALGRCHQSDINGEQLESAVWSVVCNTLLTPKLLVQALEADNFNAQREEIERQITALEREIENKAGEDQKLYRAYLADVFNETEYAVRRKRLTAEQTELQNTLAALKPQRVTEETFILQCAKVLEFAEALRSMNALVDPPFEIKQRILKMTCSRIVLNVREKWFRLEGAIRGTYTIDSITVINAPLCETR